MHTRLQHLQAMGDCDKSANDLFEKEQALAGWPGVFATANNCFLTRTQGSTHCLSRSLAVRSVKPSRSMTSAWIKHLATTKGRGSAVCHRLASSWPDETYPDRQSPRGSGGPKPSHKNHVPGLRNVADHLVWECPGLDVRAAVRGLEDLSVRLVPDERHLRRAF